jgi:hypothetical protein
VQLVDKSRRQAAAVLDLIAERGDRRRQGAGPRHRVHGMGFDADIVHRGVRHGIKPPLRPTRPVLSMDRSCLSDR